MRGVKAEFEGSGGRRQNNLRFADDKVLVCNNNEELIVMVQLVSVESCLLLNVKKTKILAVDSNRENTRPFKINGEEIQEVDEFV